MNQLKTGKRALFILIAFLFLFSATAMAEERVLPTNHYMASTIRLNGNNSTATDSTLPSIIGPAGVPLMFRTLDQLSCNTGQYDIVLRIVKPEDGTVVAETKPVHFEATNNGFVYTQPAVWKVLFPAVGWYRHEVLINGAPIVYYYFVVSFLV